MLWKSVFAKDMDIGYEFSRYLMITCFLFVNIRVYLDQEDKHEHYFFKQIKENLDLNNQMELMELLKLRKEQDAYYSSKYIDKIHVDNIKIYESKVKRMEAFIRI